MLRTRPFIHLRGGRDYKRGTLTDFACVGVTAPEPGVLRFELSEPYPHFLLDLAGPGGWPTPPGLEGTSRWPDLTSVPFNGPFRVESRRESRLVLRRNPHYWSDTFPKLERTVLLLSSGQSALEAMRYEAGAVHLSDGIAGSVAERSPRRAELRVSPRGPSYRRSCRISRARPSSSGAGAKRPSSSRNASLPAVSRSRP
jgi:ABC-type oligopeptide transport system substrate-binding subunit